MKVRSLKTQIYAQSKPHLPHVTLVKGEEYSDPETPLIVLKRAVQCKVAVVVEEMVAIAESFKPPLEIETSKVEIESKEQPKEQFEGSPKHQSKKADLARKS